MLLILLQTVSISAKHDTISQSLNNITDTLSVIVHNTNPQKIMDVELEFSNFWIGLISLAIGVLGVWFGWLAYRFSKKTANNVVRMTAENQMALFADMVRHLYRNLVCTLTMTRIQSNLKNHDFYPSEEHLLKLKMLPEDTIHLDKYNDNTEIYRVLHELKLLFRNYDTEVDVCLLHYKTTNFRYDELIKDLSTLLYKPFYLMKRIADIESEIYKYEKKKKCGFIKRFLIKKGRINIIVPDQIKNISEIIISEHFAKLTENLKPETYKKWWKNYQYLDYINQKELPLYHLARGFDVLKDKIQNEEKDYTISFDWLISELNTNMTHSVKDKYRTEDVFALLRDKQAFENYVSVIDKKNYRFTEFISYALSLDVAIEMSKIRFIKT